MKKLIAVVLVVAMAFGLTGCYGGEIEVYNAMKKLQEMESMESTTEIEFDFSTEGFSEEDQMMLDEVGQVINGLKMKMDIRQTQNEDQTKATAKMDTNIQAMGMDMNMEQWVTVDLTGDKPEMKQIIKMPEELMGTMLPEGINKEYIYFDMMEQEGLGDDFDELIEFSEEFQPKLMEFINEFYAGFDSDLDFISKKDRRIVNGKYLDIYEVNLDDSSLKELVRYGVNHTLEDETTMDFIKEYMDAVMSITAIPEEDRDEMETEIQGGLEELETQLPEIKNSFNDFLNEYEDIKILGEDGIKVEIGIDEKGYVVHEDGKIDIRIDISEITEAIGVEPMEGIINLGINYTTRNYNINNKLIWVRMPNLTEGNTIEYMELLEEQERQLEEQLKQFEEMEDFQDYDELTPEEIEELEKLYDLEELEDLEEDPAA